MNAGELVRADVEPEDVAIDGAGVLKACGGADGCGETVVLGFG